MKSFCLPSCVIRDMYFNEHPNTNFHSTPISHFTAQSLPLRQDLQVIPMNTFSQSSYSTNDPKLQPIFMISTSDQMGWAPTESNFQPAPPSYTDVVQSSINVSNKRKSKKPAPQPFTPGYKWPRRSIQLVCPNCGATVITRVDKSITFVTVIMAILLLIFTFFLACLPFCIAACKKATHYCPYCNSLLGKRSALR